MSQFRLILVMILICMGDVWGDSTKFIVPFKGSIHSISQKKRQQLQTQSMDKSFMDSLNDLVCVQLSYWGFDGHIHQGSIIVHKALAQDILDIFAILYQQKFPIESMKLMDVFGGDDAASMAANNTSAYNYRKVTGHPGIYSQHSYGRAIDINPFQNPYVKKGLILPLAAKSFVSRDNLSPGKITRDSLIYQAFTQRGWDWGGDWYDVQDYQHFEKRANGEKRNPFGY